MLMLLMLRQELGLPDQFEHSPLPTQAQPLHEYAVETLKNLEEVR